MPITVLWALIIYMLISSFTPGPGNILALNTMTKHGWEKGRNLFLGICAGYFAVQIICIIGIYGLSRYLSEALIWMKYIGGIYLIWLAIHIVRSSPEFHNEEKMPSFWTGFLLQFVNVKIYFYGITLLSGYIVPYYKSIYSIIIAEILVTAVGSFATFMWALMGIKIQDIYFRHFKFINVIFGIFLVFCAWNMVNQSV